MILNIELYKESFTDVRLIYNRDEKLRRYVLCEANYSELMVEYRDISELVVSLTEDKD